MRRSTNVYQFGWLRFHWRSILWSVIFLVISQGLSAQQNRLVVEENNVYGGQTVEYRDSDDSMILEFYDDDEIMIKQERVFTTEYPIDNGLRKIVTYYSFEKKTKEEKIYSSRISQSTLIERTIDYYDRFTGLKTKSENHFIDAFPGHNIIYRENGKKTRIEWYYPHNMNGIIKHIVYFDAKEKAAKVESFYSEKTTAEEGYYRRVYYNNYTPNNYFRKTVEEIFFTDEYANQHDGVSKVIKHFHYRPGKLFDIEIHLFDKEDKKLFLSDESIERYQELD